MHLYERETILSNISSNERIIEYLAQNVLAILPEDEIPIRFVITNSENEIFTCEIGVMAGVGKGNCDNRGMIFDFRKRRHENIDSFNAVLIIPTGIGAEIGGHSGDGGPVARLLASACDNLITHPNVVNASDINELPENGLYVEGSVITRLLMGTICLQKVRSNKIGRAHV